ncbi:MAG: O-antigen ligase family protein [Lachnospiraceae bacterium]|nr:O-antigen ligase family protein [Lachnospiraceae bacterium]
MDKRNFDMCVRIPFLTESVALAIIPFEEVLTLPIGSVLRLVNLLTIFCCLIESRKIKIEIGRKYPLLPMLSFLLYAAVSLLWCFNSTYYLDRLSTYMLYGVLILLLCSLNPNEEEKIRMLNGLFVGGIIASLMIVFSGASLDIGGRDTLVIFGQMIDPNILSYSCVLSLVICMYRLIIEKKNKVINVAISGILLMAIVICGSRGALVCCLGTIVAIIMNIDVKKNKFLKKLLVFTFIFATLLLAYFEYVLPSEFGSRFTLDNLIGQGSMGMANRDKIWSAALTQIAQRPILGYGNGASMYAIEAVYRFYGTHNTYILILLEFGVIGFGIVFLWQLRVYKMCSKNRSKIYKILFLSMLLFVLFVEGFSTKVFWGLQVLLMTTCYGENTEHSIGVC